MKDVISWYTSTRIKKKSDIRKIITNGFIIFKARLLKVKVNKTGENGIAKNKVREWEKIILKVDFQ